MTDWAETELRKWALARPNGDPIGPQDIVKLVFAFDDDNTKKFATLSDRLDDFEEKLGADLARFATIEETLTLLGDRQTTWELECPSRERQQDEAHRDFHEQHLREEHTVAPRRMGDPPDSEFTEHRERAFPVLTPQQTSFFQLMAAWSVTKRVVAIVATALLLAAVATVTSYIGGYYASLHAETIERTQNAPPSSSATPTP